MIWWFIALLPPLAIALAWPGSRFEPAAGLGHRRLLIDAGVIARSVAFIAGEVTA